MTVDEVLELWVPARLAEVLETSKQNVSGWLKAGRIPRCREYELQVKSGGRLLASDYDPARDYVFEGRIRWRRLP